MKTPLSLLVTAAVLAAAFTPAAASAQSARRIEVPAVPANLEVPAGHEVFLEGQATGTQNYICLPSGAGYAWSFLAPQATLFLTIGDRRQQQITTHFLSSNPVENGTPRPTWQQSFDSSQVWGRPAASSLDPNFVAPNSIPWLLVEAVGVASGPTGGSQLAQTTFVQRLNTQGGIAPAAGCSSAANVGARALVPYTTDYFFYRAIQ